MIGMRVLKGHLTAVKEALATLPDGDADDIARHIAEKVLTANDSKMRYVVVTSDYCVFGPYASRSAAQKATQTGGMAYRPDTSAMVLPMQPHPKN